jgi:outer membrane protein assembly factor BamB
VRTRALLLSLVGISCGGSRLSTPPVLFPAPEAWKSSDAAGIEPPLASDGERVFVARRDGSLQALDAGDGRRLWEAKRAGGRVSAAPGIVLVRGADGQLTRLDPASGRRLWSVSSGVPGTAPAVPDGDQVYVAGTGLAALSLKDGTLQWTAAEAADVTAPPVASAARLFVGEEDGTLRCRDRATGLTRWTLATGGALRAPAVLDGEQLLLGTTDGRFLAVSTESGKVRWTWRLGADVAHAAALFQDGSVLFASYENVLYALDQNNGHLRWRAALPSRPVEAPLMVGTAALVACQESDVVAFDARTGRPLASLAAPGDIGAAPIVVGGRLHLGLRDRSLLALALDLTPSKEVKWPRGPRPTPPPEVSGERPRQGQARKGGDLP